MQNNDKKYKELRIMSTDLLIPRNTYQRELNTDRVHKIVKQFDERVANEPKVSFRNGSYYVFDGQHTIAARVERNGGNPLMILCKVYYGLTEKDEARLFAEQTGFSADLGAGPRIRALVFAEDENPSGGGPCEPGDDAQQGALALPRSSADAERLALLDNKVRSRNQFLFTRLKARFEEPQRSRLRERGTDQSSVGKVQVFDSEGFVIH